MHSHVWGSHRAKFDDDNSNSFRGIACEGQVHTQTRSRLILNFVKSNTLWTRKKNKQALKKPQQRQTSKEQKEILVACVLQAQDTHTLTRGKHRPPRGQATAVGVWP